MPKPKKEEAMETVKCTLKLPRAVWREGRIRAMDEGRDFQDIVSEALELYLKAPAKRGREGR
jgi:hypothetical protein